MFDDVSNKYDLMNDLMSFGLHRFGKSLIRNLKNEKANKILDLAGGTGDISRAIAKSLLIAKFIYMI